MCDGNRSSTTHLLTVLAGAATLLRVVDGLVRLAGRGAEDRGLGGYVAAWYVLRRGAALGDLFRLGLRGRLDVEAKSLEGLAVFSAELRRDANLDGLRDLAGLVVALEDDLARPVRVRVPARHLVIRV